MIKIYDCFDTPQFIYIVLEYCDGGNLQEKIDKEGELNEEYAKEVLRQILMGVQILEKQNIAHRDIKPENIFIAGGKHKLGDFGFAKQKSMFSTQLGTPPYQAPEYFNSYNQSNKVDVWSTGVLFHQILFKEIYFVEGVTNQLQLQQNILQKKYELNQTQKTKVSTNC